MFTVALKNIAKIQKQLESTTDEDLKVDLASELELEQEDLKMYSEQIEELKQKLSNFGSDKSDFLYEYINLQIHGPGWLLP